MPYHPRIESPTYISFITTRSRNSELWFVNNESLEKAILGYVAKFTNRYQVDLYALAIEGNHMQLTVEFPHNNRAYFMRDLNSCVARAVDRHCPTYPGGRFWARRYSQEFVPTKEDTEERFFYTVLQPVQDGLVERVSQYPHYNCFNDAVKGIKRKYKVVNWSAYYNAKRWNEDVSIEDFVEVVELEYKRLPGYEHLSKEEYVKEMHRKLNERQEEIVQSRRKAGKGFLGVQGLKTVRPGDRPKNTKTSDIKSHRPRVLSKSNEARAQVKAWYFSLYFEYKDASKRYRAGEQNVRFPMGMYPPWRPSVPVVSVAP
jgi:hypothetical protein